MQEHGLVSLSASAPRESCMCTWKEDKDFDSFAVLPPAVRVLTVHGETGEVPCVCAGGVDQSQNAVSLLLGRPVGTNKQTNEAT